MRRAAGRLRFTLRAAGLLQLGVLIACATRIAASRVRAHLVPHGDPQARRVQELQWIGAALGRLKGPFAKLAQFGALRVDLLPEEAREALLRLRDRVPPLPAAWIRWMLERELRAPLETCFRTFDPHPLGSASIAQVHRATLPDGRRVAVKVQYPWLQGSVGADMRLLRLLARWLGRGAAPTDAVFAEFARGLREELDFCREARVASEIARNLADDTQVVVPRVVSSHSSRRVLTMELLPTLPLTDRGALAARGIAAAEVLEIVARAYARQVFVDGLFHADPHPGNLFVIDEPGADRHPRVLFVDFGLSKHLDAGLREELRRGILALLQGDIEAFLDGMQRMGMIAPGAEEAVRKALHAMFARLRGAGGSPLALGAARVLDLKDQAKQLLYETPGLTLPSDLLHYARTVAYLFRLGQELDPEVDLMKLAVPYLLRFLSDSSGAGPAGG